MVKFGYLYLCPYPYAYPYSFLILCSSSPLISPRLFAYIEAIDVAFYRFYDPTELQCFHRNRWDMLGIGQPI